MSVVKSSEKSIILKRFDCSFDGLRDEFVMVFLAKNLALTGVRGVNAVDPCTSLPFLRCG